MGINLKYIFLKKLLKNTGKVLVKWHQHLTRRLNYPKKRYNKSNSDLQATFKQKLEGFTVFIQGFNSIKNKKQALRKKQEKLYDDLLKKVSRDFRIESVANSKSRYVVTYRREAVSEANLTLKEARILCNKYIRHKAKEIIKNYRRKNAS